jgi:hypothetical protein
VGGRTKIILLGAVIAAILYVLISPLPELAATSTLKFPLLPLVLIVLLLGAQLPSSGFVRWARITAVSERDILWSRNRILLC